MKLIVGLGNKGKEYQNTRHNMGFFFLDAYADTKHVSITKEKFNGKYAEFIENDEKIILLEPQSYMNLSGEVVGKFVSFFHIPLKDLFIIHDDLDLPLGTLKLKKKGSSGGHNGLKNIELHLQTQEYQRLKLGISNDKTKDTKDYVLGHFSKEEQEQINAMKTNIINIIDDFLHMDFEQLMAKYNKK